jgi:hypothetical protein
VTWLKRSSSLPVSVLLTRCLPAQELRTPDGDAYPLVEEQQQQQQQQQRIPDQA